VLHLFDCKDYECHDTDNDSGYRYSKYDLKLSFIRMYRRRLTRHLCLCSLPDSPEVAFLPGFTLLHEHIGCMRFFFVRMSTTELAYGQESNNSSIAAIAYFGIRLINGD